MARTIWLIRHGESESNAGLPSSDPATIPITPLGQRQAAAVARAFGAPPDLIVASRFRQGLRLPNGVIVPLRYSTDEGFWIGQMMTAHLVDAGAGAFEA